MSPYTWKPLIMHPAKISFTVFGANPLNIVPVKMSTYTVSIPHNVHTNYRIAKNCRGDLIFMVFAVVHRARSKKIESVVWHICTAGFRSAKTKPTCNTTQRASAKIKSCEKYRLNEYPYLS